uniref:PGG domain-containing protein n=1 Tax=Setaria italica TaxID=4555 RepID=K3Z441_SETIT
MASINEEEAPSSPNAPTVAMDAKLMVAADRGDVKKLKGLLNKEDAMAMVVVTAATSKKPSKEDQFPAGRINPLLLASACVGSWKALNFLLEREDAKKAPMVAPTQDFLELLAGGSGTKGRSVVSAAGDVEEGVDHEPAPPAAGALLKGVTPDGDTTLHAVASNGDNGDDFLKYAGIICDRDRDLLFAKNHMGDTPLHCAVRAGSSKMVSRLIALAEHEGAEGKLKLLRMENERHETALHEAVRIEEKNMVRLLMDSDPELANYPAKGISPLCLAILLEKDTIAVTLYEKSGGNLSYSGPDGQNALHVAVLQATSTNTVMVKVLLRWNRSLPTQGDKHGSTPLHFASSLHCPFGFFWYPHWTRNYWRTRISNIVAKVFKANPAALYQADNSGLFPIHVAASIGTVEFFLRKSPSSAGLRNAKGRTFLHVAVEKRRWEIVSFVCQTPSAEWILNMQDKDGNTALHLAIKSRMLMMCSALLGNKKVHLHLSNVKGHTPLDLSRSNLPRGMYYALTAESRIHMALKLFGAKHSGLRCDHIEQKYRRPLNQKEKKKQSNLIKDTTQMFIVVAILIATVAFGATFAIPGGYKADDHLNGGTPTLAGRYIFDAYMMANTLAFVCSTVATLALVISGSTMVDLGTRQWNLNAAVFMLSSSVTSMTVAFALAAYMVLAPVARSTAIAIFMISPLPVLYRNVEKIFKWGFLARARLVRMGPIPTILNFFAVVVIQMILMDLWPLIATFAWAAFARIHH